jgi:hypothetical protein
MKGRKSKDDRMGHPSVVLAPFNSQPLLYSAHGCLFSFCYLFAEQGSFFFLFFSYRYCFLKISIEQWPTLWFSS